jgi:hypothetical protein
MARWLERAGLDLSRTYSERELDQAMSTAGLTTLQRMAIKSELYDRKLVRASAGADPHRVVQASSHTMRASAAERPRGKLLRNPDGSLATLRGTAD